MLLQELRGRAGAGCLGAGSQGLHRGQHAQAPAPQLLNTAPRTSSSHPAGTNTVAGWLSMSGCWPSEPPFTWVQRAGAHHCILNCHACACCHAGYTWVGIWSFRYCKRRQGGRGGLCAVPWVRSTECRANSQGTAARRHVFTSTAPMSSWVMGADVHMLTPG